MQALPFMITYGHPCERSSMIAGPLDVPELRAANACRWGAAATAFAWG